MMESKTKELKHTNMLKQALANVTFFFGGVGGSVTDWLKQTFFISVRTV